MGCNAQSIRRPPALDHWVVTMLSGSTRDNEAWAVSAQEVRMRTVWHATTSRTPHRNRYRYRCTWARRTREPIRIRTPIFALSGDQGPPKMGAGNSVEARVAPGERKEGLPTDVIDYAALEGLEALEVRLRDLSGEALGNNNGFVSMLRSRARPLRDGLAYLQDAVVALADVSACGGKGGVI